VLTTLEIFGTFNGLALIHMFLTAPETKGKTLEEMDDVFDRGIPAWKSSNAGSRLDQVQRDIANSKSRQTPLPLAKSRM
jgi:hypothetical protein